MDVHDAYTLIGQWASKFDEYKEGPKQRSHLSNLLTVGLVAIFAVAGREGILPDISAFVLFIFAVVGNQIYKYWDGQRAQKKLVELKAELLQWSDGEKPEYVVEAVVRNNAIGGWGWRTTTALLNKKWGNQIDEDWESELSEIFE